MGAPAPAVRKPGALAPRPGLAAPGQTCEHSAYWRVGRSSAMKFGLFYEHQNPRPWTERSEHRVLMEALQQIELADKLGLDYVWEVEHHFLEEYSHSSAPAVFLA